MDRPLRLDNARGLRRCLTIGFAALAGCAGEPLVTRVEHGRVEVGPAIAPAAYAESLRASLEHAGQARAERLDRCAVQATTAAVDDALLRGDLGLARNEATCARMQDAELSLRAWYFGHGAFSAKMIDARLAAEPSWHDRTVAVGAVVLLRPRGRLGEALLAWALALRGHERAAAHLARAIPPAPQDQVLTGLVRRVADARAVHAQEHAAIH